jgi:probable F420-dependent oxidoreductase
MAVTSMGEGGLAVGLQLPVQAQSTIFAQAWEPAAGGAEIVSVARACEQAGFAYVAACDHVAIPEGSATAMGTDWWDTVATLAFVAGATERIALLSHVYVLAYRHPLQVAKAWATLDALSGGRAVLGVGAGHVEGEFDALGVPFADRGRLLDEAIDAVRAALSDEFPRHEGSRWSFSGLGQRPRPVQDHLPIWVGGSSPPAMRRAAERGDGWLPQGPPAGGMAAAIEAIRDRRDEIRDDPITIGALSGPLHLGPPAWEAGRCRSGSADELADLLRSFRSIGVDQVQVSFPSRSCAELCDQIAGFGAEVLPLVSDGAAA